MTEKVDNNVQVSVPNINNIPKPPPFLQAFKNLQDADVGIPGDIQLDADGQLLKKYLIYGGFSKPIIDIYDDWLDRILPEQVRLTSLPLPNGNNLVFRLHYELPRQTPMECREANVTYTIDLSITIEEVDRTGKFVRNVGQDPNGVRRYSIGTIPLMLGSKYSHVFNKTAHELEILREDPSDPFGYFVIEGIERVLLLQENLRTNRIFVFPGQVNAKSTTKGYMTARMTCNTLKQQGLVLLTEGENREINLTLQFMGTESKKVTEAREPRSEESEQKSEEVEVKRPSKKPNSIGIFQAFRILAAKIDDKENNTNLETRLSTFKNLMAAVIKFTLPQWQREVTSAFNRSFDKLYMVADDYYDLARKKGLINESRQLTDEIKQKLFEDFNKDLFPHIEATELRQKFNLLAIMTCKLTEIMIGKRTEADNRDSWSNKRLQSAGNLLPKEVGRFWNRLLKQVLSEMEKSTLSSENIARILSEQAGKHITLALQSSFTGQWGAIPGRGGKLKEGSTVTDILNANNIVSLYAHIRRINTPTDRSTKQSGPRSVQTSQYAYVCPVETPENENCLHEDEEVLMGDGSYKKMKELKNGDVITTVDPVTFEIKTTGIHNHFLISSEKYGKKVYELTTINGRKIIATEDHPFLTQDGWVLLKDLNIETDKICIYPTLNRANEKPIDKIILTEEMFTEQLRKANVKESLITKHCDDLKKVGLIPLNMNSQKLPIIARMMGFVLTDGSLGIYESVPSASFTFGTKNDAEEFEKDMINLELPKAAIREKHSIVDDGKRRVEHHTWVTQHTNCYPSLLLALGIAHGRKTEHPTNPIPEWLMNGTKFIKREFLAGFQGGDGCKVAWYKQSNKAGKICFMHTMQHKCQEHVDTLISFMAQVRILFEEFNIKILDIVNHKESDNRVSAKLRFSDAEENIIKYIDLIGYRYANSKNIESHLVTEYLKYKQVKIKERDVLKNTIISLRQSGIKPSMIAKQLNMRLRLVTSILEYRGTKSIIPKDTMTYEDWCKLVMPKSECLFMPIAKVSEHPPCMVGDFTTDADTHTFITSEGHCTHNCGLVKNLAITATLSIDTDDKIVAEMMRPYLYTEPTPDKRTIVILNGKPMGWAAGATLRDYLRQQRRQKIGVPWHTCIALDKYATLHVYTDGARPIRPLLIVNDRNELIIDKKNLWQASWDEIVAQGAAEFVDAFEAEYIYIAPMTHSLKFYHQQMAKAKENLIRAQADLARFENDDPDVFLPLGEVREIEEYIRNQDSKENKRALATEPTEKAEEKTTEEELFDPDSELRITAETKNYLIRRVQKNEEIVASMSKKPPYSHCEIDPTSLFSVAASLTPFPDHNQAPRNTFNAKMTQQAVSVPRGYQYRDETMKVLTYPQRALFETQTAQTIGMERLPTGQPVYMAVATWRGFNQEDSIVFNKTAIDNGLFAMYKFKSYEETEAPVVNNKNTYIEEKIQRPEPRPNDPPGIYRFLDERGIAKEGSSLKAGDCVIGKVQKVTIVNDETKTATVRIRNISKYIGFGEEGVVDRVLIVNNKNQKIIKVRTRQFRQPIVGDKFAHRSAQKGTIGMILPDVDMPEIGFGIRATKPALIVNPACLTGDSMVVLPSGLSRRIDSLAKEGGNLVWGWNGKGLVISKQIAMEPKGKKDIIQITMEDGRTIKCTPDHRFLTLSNDEYKWVEAKDMIALGLYDGRTWIRDDKKSATRIIMGYEGVIDDPTPEEREKEKAWKLDIFNMSTLYEREKALAFARLLGAILTDGCVSVGGWTGDESLRKYIRYPKERFVKSETPTFGQPGVTANLGHQIDAQIMLADIALVTGKEPSPYFSKGVWAIHFPAELARIIASLPGVTIGRRSGQKAELPHFLFEADCPTSIIREFLGGLFGGDGHAPSYYDMNKFDNSGTYIRGPAFSQLICKPFADSLKEKMEKICQLLEKVDVTDYRIYDPKERDPGDNSFKADDHETNPRVEAKIELLPHSSFSKNVGYRYCVQKTSRLSVAAAYWRFRETMKSQHDRVVKRTVALYEAGGTSIARALKDAQDELLMREAPVNNRYSLSWLYDINNRRSRSKKNDKAYELTKIEYDHCPDAEAFLKNAGCFKWFREKYITDRNTDYIESFSLRVLDIRPAGKADVFDISVAETESFVVEGLVSHNCIPSRMTMGMILEIFGSTLGSIQGERYNASAFRPVDIDEWIAQMRDYGFQPMGNYKLRDPYTGEMTDAMIFAGIAQYMQLRHHVRDKYQARATGPVNPTTRQPVHGRGVKGGGGGLRLGNMERDAILSHGASGILIERFKTSSDACKVLFCTTCGQLAADDIVNSRIFCRRCGDRADIGQFEVPYVYKLLIDVLKLAGIRTTHVFHPTHEIVETPVPKIEQKPSVEGTEETQEEKGKEKVPEPKVVAKKRAPARKTAKK